MTREYPENDYRNYLEHSAKGQKWSSHKYLYITPSGRYVYPEDEITMKNLRNMARNSKAASDKASANQQQFANTHRGHARKTDYENIYNVYETKKPTGLKRKVGNTGVFSGRGVKNYKKSADQRRVERSNVNDLLINGKKQKLKIAYGSHPSNRTTKKSVTTRSNDDSFRERFEAALATDLKNSAKKQWEARTSSSIPDHIVQKKGIKKRSKIARYLSRKKFGGRTTVRRGRGGIYSGSSRKF